MNSKLVLGTAQFGLDYGINNSRGIIPIKEIGEILKLAHKNKIDTLDTSGDYGNAEHIIGKLITDSIFKFKIISKLGNVSENQVEYSLNKTLENLGINSIHGYLIHHADHYFKNKNVWEKIVSLKEKGKTTKIGFSVYNPSELKKLLNLNIKLDIIQLPYNLFDQRFEAYFKDLDKRGIEVYTRSTFLQGLLLKNPDTLPPYFKKVKNKLLNLRNLSDKINVPLPALCLLFITLNPKVNKVIIGVDSVEHLESNINSFKYIVAVKKIYKTLFSYTESDRKIILPTLWKL